MNDNNHGPLLAVAFDFDGLMFNTEDIWDVVDEVILERRGHTSRPDVVAQMMGRQSQDAIRIMIDAYGLDDSVQQLEAESGEVFLGLVDRAQPMPGFRDLLDALITADIPRAITTSIRPELLLPIVEHWNLIDKFLFRLTSDDVEKSKPNPEIYLSAAKNFGVPVEKMLVLEDSQVGAAAGVAAGAMTVAVPSKLKGQVSFPGTAMVVESLEDPRIYAVLGL